MDRIWAEAPPGGKPFEGFTLRQFDPSDRVWRIWWASSNQAFSYHSGISRDVNWIMELTRTG